MDFSIVLTITVLVFLIFRYKMKISKIENRVKFLEDRFSLVYSLLENKNAE